MFILILLGLLSSKTNALFCNIYDHSQKTVKCVQQCPSGTSQVNNLCLTDQQYVFNGQVFPCKGYVSPDKTVCCQPDQYLQAGQCVPCRGQVFNGGLSCCPSDHYLDLTQNTPNCLEISTGSCSTILLSSPFKVCCPADRMYHLSTGQCVAPLNFNCDPTNKVCCGSAQRA